MARLILHIGTHKTATTTVQKTFQANRKLLEKNGLVYPELGRTAGHHGLVTDWVNLPAVFHLPEGSAAAWKALVKKYARGDHTVFLSSEEFSRGHPNGRLDLETIRSWLDPFDDIQVICSLRDQVAFLQSIYLEISKKNAPPYWGAFLNNSIKNGYGAGLFLDYTALDDHLLRAFSTDQIHYVDYASAAQDPGILTHMLALAGSNLNADALMQNPDISTANVSPDPLTSWVASMVARPNTPEPALLTLIEQKMRDDIGPDRKTTLYVRSEIERLRKKTDPLNLALHERLANRQPDFRLSPTKFPDDIVYRNDLKTSFWIALSNAMYNKSS